MRLFPNRSSKSITEYESHKITIRQVPGPELQHGRRHYCVDILVDDVLKFPKRSFYDPSSAEDDQSCALYLNELLKKDKYDAVIARKTETAINEYGRELFKRLALGTVSDDLTHPKLVIEVREADRHNGTQNTIHRLRWEQLEDWNLWPEIESRFITVRRITPQVPNVEINPEKSIANDLREKEKGRINIVLELVRPGTFKEFKRHLASRPPGYFDIVHFDVHGKIIDTPSSTQEAFLQFVHDDFLSETPKTRQNGLVEVSASDVAEVLHCYKIPCAVLNACKSAHPFSGDCGNLSRLFSRKNSLKILAMSFNITGAAVKMICEDFYMSFLRDLISFSDAASRARRTLRENRVRIEPCPCIKLHDWFVPVTYAHTDGGIVNTFSMKDLWRSKISQSLSPPSLSSLHVPLSFSSRRSGSSASSIVSSRKSTEHDTSAFLKLRMEDLVFERQVMRDKVIRLFGPNKDNNESYIGYVTDLWRITNFAEQPYTFQAKTYLDDPGRELTKAKEYIWGSSRGPHNALLDKLTNSTKSNSLPRPVIIVYNSEALFPQPISDVQSERRDAFFEEIIYKPKAYGEHFRSPYLIFVSTEDIQLPSIRPFPKLGGERFPFSDRPKTEPYNSFVAAS